MQALPPSSRTGRSSLVGLELGNAESEGKELGSEDGSAEGIAEGSELGVEDGCVLGVEDGSELGIEDGGDDGSDDGCIDGWEDGSSVMVPAVADSTEGELRILPITAPTPSDDNLHVEQGPGVPTSTSKRIVSRSPF